MKREAIKIELDNQQYEFYSKPTILEEQLIRDGAAEFTGGGLQKLVELETSRNTFLDKCLVKDENGNIIRDDKDDSIKVDVKCHEFKMYNEYQRILDNAYFYGILRIMLVTSPAGFDAKSLEGIKFHQLKSAFEDALDSFREQERNPKTGKNGEGNSRTVEQASA